MENSTDGDNDYCVCGHLWKEHQTSKIPDGTGGRIENDEHKCDFWEGCGCDGFEVTQD